MRLQEVLKYNKRSIAGDVSEEYIEQSIKEGKIKVYSTVPIQKGIEICLSADIIRRITAGKEFFQAIIPIENLNMENCCFGKIKKEV